MLELCGSMEKVVSMKSRFAEAFHFEGNQRAVLLLHGYSGSTADVKQIGRKFNQAGYSVFAFNFPGHSTGSHEDILTFSPEEIYADVILNIEKIYQKGYTQLAIFGLSFGGSLATKAIIDGYSRVGGGIFNSELLSSIKDTNLYQFFLESAFQQIIRRKIAPDQAKNELNILKIPLQKRLEEIDSFNQKIVTSFPLLELPFYIAQSGQDQIISPDSGQRLLPYLSHVTISFHHFPKATHLVTLGKSLPGLQKTLIDFTDRLNWIL